METVEESQNKPKIVANPIMIHKIVEKGEEDRISGLPDCLLLEILSRLPSTKYAIRTGTLSKRWKHLWTLVPSLIFDGSIRQSDFVFLVSKTLTQCRQLKLKKFGLYTCYNTRFQSEFNDCIRYAVSCNVEELAISLWKWKVGTKFVLDQFFFINTCFTYLKLSCCIFNPIGSISWKNLRSLCITRVKLNEVLIENILSGSPVMETLVLDRCYGFRLLDITSKSVKNLVFTGYSDPVRLYDDDIVEINAPNILSLTIQGNMDLRKVSLVNVSSLVKAYLDYENCWIQSIFREERILKGFILKLGHVKELKVGNFCSEVVSRLENEGFILPTNMKFLDATSPS